MEPAVVFWTEIRAWHVRFFSPIFSPIFRSIFQQTLWDSCSPIFQHTNRQQELRRISFFSDCSNITLIIQHNLFKYSPHKYYKKDGSAHTNNTTKLVQILQDCGAHTKIVQHTIIQPKYRADQLKHSEAHFSPDG
jgi:hypothetical protein